MELSSGLLTLVWNSEKRHDLGIQILGLLSTWIIRKPQEKLRWPGSSIQSRKRRGPREAKYYNTGKGEHCKRDLEIHRKKTRGCNVKETEEKAI